MARLGLGLPRIAPDCLGLSQIALDCPGLPWIALDCPRLSRITPDCPGWMALDGPVLAADMTADGWPRMCSDAPPVFPANVTTTRHATRPQHSRITGHQIGKGRKLQCLVHSI